MDIPTFLELFIKELEINHDLRDYYRLLNLKSRYYWRKAYLEQRLAYVNRKVGAISGRIWDVGCGYATTSIFLTLNGQNVYGNTLEFYYDRINPRIDYWSRYGNLENLKVEYANLYDLSVPADYYNAVIAQDTLHHLEPIGDAIRIFEAALKPGCSLIVTEENGRNAFITLRNIYYRGFERVTTYYDELLQKAILFGNENARSLRAWQSILEKGHLELNEDSVEYIRVLPPFCFTEKNYYSLMEKEMQAGKKLLNLREFLFFGINFTAIKPL
jgi:2-polyprenyl-3-methyl-5-hydroxy-6-metoxy-1,4-benzoquinol methylase